MLWLLPDASGCSAGRSDAHRPEVLNRWNQANQKQNEHQIHVPEDTKNTEHQRNSHHRSRHGVGLVEHVASRYPLLRTVIITGHSPALDAARAAGADAFLSKRGLRKKELIDTVRVLLEPDPTVLLKWTPAVPLTRSERHSCSRSRGPRTDLWSPRAVPLPGFRSIGEESSRTPLMRLPL